MTSADSKLDEAIAALHAGELIIFPTETFYGIGADPHSTVALEKIFSLKGREPDKPIALIAADSGSAFGLAQEVPACARHLADVFWPGPLTMVLPARSNLHPALLGPSGVGVRVSSHPIAKAIAAGFGGPITATSANLSGHPSVTRLSDLPAVFFEKIKVMVDGGELAGGAPSTVVEIINDGYRIARAGAISETAIASALKRS